METKYNLPRGYLSFSAYSLWKKNKEGYRKRYYLNEESFSSPQTRFGHEQHKIMEEDESIKGSETPLECFIDDGLKILGKLDVLDPDTLKIIDFKFSHITKSGKAPWDVVKVRKHEQFPYYCLLVRETYQRYNSEVELHWYETKFKENRIAVFEGRTYEFINNNLERTGRVEIIKRIVEEWEIDRMKEEIIKAALEISKDYTQWQKEHVI